MDYQACLNYLQQNCRRGVPGGYERTMRMAELLGQPQEQLQTIHIAGTNGKGSTAAILEAILRQAGYRVGLYTSPHLSRYEERIQINRQPIPERDFAQIMTRLIEQVIPLLQAEGFAHPGEFELLTVAGWLYFAQQTDFVISEVGLGGTLDPTNVVQKPVLSVITPISLDHCEILGDTLAQIAAEKAGILKSEVPAIAAPQQPEAAAVLAAEADRRNAPLTILQPEQLQAVSTNLQGRYQQINCNTALAAIENLQQRRIIHILPEQLATALQKVSWPGRMEYWDLGSQKGILLDGAHNQAGIQYLAEQLHVQYSQRRIILFLSILDDKAQLPMLETILPLSDTVVLTKPEHDQRAQHWKQLQQTIQTIAPHCHVTLYEQYQEGLTAVLADLQPDDLLCITGSLYLLGDCRHFLRQVLFP